MPFDRPASLLASRRRTWRHDLPRKVLDRVGPRIVVALTKRPHTRVLSARDAGAANTGLRPKPNAAMIVVSVDRTEKAVVNYDQPAVEQLVTRQIGAAPITPYITGQPSIDRALKTASINDLRQHELIAAGIVFVLLLIGLRAPLAALLVTVKATASMLAAFGEVALLGHFMKLDVIGVAAGSMTGLAVGVGLGLEFVGDLMTMPLDRSRPLWHTYMIDGYGDGAAMICRMHHCIADGIALARVMLSLTDAAPGGGIAPPDHRDGRTGGGTALADSVREAVGDLARFGVAAGRQGTQIATSPTHAARLAGAIARDSGTALRLLLTRRMLRRRSRAIPASAVASRGPSRSRCPRSSESRTPTTRRSTTCCWPQ